MRFHLSVLLALILAGCSSLDTGPMSEKYAEAARALGVNPVYPPREEFQIGDVFLVSSIPDDPNSSVSVWLGTVDGLLAEANEFLKSRVVFDTTGVSTADGKTPKLDQPDLFSPEVVT